MPCYSTLDTDGSGWANRTVPICLPALLSFSFSCWARFGFTGQPSRISREARIRASARPLRHLLPLFVLALAAAVIYGLLAWWHDSFQHNAFVIGSYTTMKLRKPVPPSSVERGFHALIWILRWIVV